MERIALGVHRQGRNVDRARQYPGVEFFNRGRSGRVREEILSMSKSVSRKGDPLKPSMTLLCKLGSIAVHAEEFLSPNADDLDLAAIRALLTDAERDHAMDQGHGAVHAGEAMRDRFETWVLATRKQTQPYGLVERAGENGEKYLDLYTQKQWEGWQAALTTLNQHKDGPVRKLVAKWRSEGYDASLFARELETALAHEEGSQ